MPEDVLKDESPEKVEQIVKKEKAKGVSDTDAKKKAETLVANQKKWLARRV